MAFYRCVGGINNSVDILIDDEIIIASNQGSNIFNVSLSSGDYYVVSLKADNYTQIYTETKQANGNGFNHTFGGSNYSFVITTTGIQVACTSGSWRTIRCKLSKIDSSQYYS